MESKALSTTRPSGGALTEVEQIIADVMQEDQHAYDYIPVRYKIVSQANIFKNIGDESDTPSQLDGIILMSRKNRAYWEPNDDDPRPRCISRDGITGEWRTDANTTRLLKCATCPRNQWGSEIKDDGKSGRGKGCKEMRRFLILRAGYDVPVVLTIPPTSCQSFDRYASGLRTLRSAYFAVETIIGLEKAESADGYEYRVAVFKPNGQLDKDVVAWVVSLRQQFGEALGVAPEYDEYYDNGHAVDADSWDAVDTAMAEDTPF